MTSIAISAERAPEQAPVTPPLPQEQTALKVDRFASMIFSIGNQFFEVQLEGKCADQRLWVQLKRSLERALPYHFKEQIPKQMAIAQMGGTLQIGFGETCEPLNSQYCLAIDAFLQQAVTPTAGSEQSLQTLFLTAPQPPEFAPKAPSVPRQEEPAWQPQPRIAQNLKPQKEDEEMFYDCEEGQ